MQLLKFDILIIKTLFSLTEKEK